MTVADLPTTRWRVIAQAMTRPYRVTLPMVLLVSLVPFYLFIPDLRPVEQWNAPALALDRAIPLLPSWSLVYGALYLFLIVLPILAIREEDPIRRTVHAYLLAWITAYAFFIAWPTVAPRPPGELVEGTSFGAWGLRLLYGADPPYNCFPSLHVAHSFISALALRGLHRPLGALSLGAASLVAVSTLFTKQHYVLDVVAGVALAVIAWALFLRPVRPEEAREGDRRAGPLLAALLAALLLAGLGGFWLAYAAGL